MTEQLQMRLHGDRSQPCLIYLPGVHGDWTLLPAFREAMGGRACFVEFTYPRDAGWQISDYVQGIRRELRAAEVTSGWLLAESFGSLVAWSLLEEGAVGDFRADGLILAGGFVRHPTAPVARVFAEFTRSAPAWMARLALRTVVTCNRWRFRGLHEALRGLDEFAARRTPEDIAAMAQRLELVAATDPRPIASAIRIPVWQLNGLLDPIVPWLPVRGWLRRHCPGFRGCRTIAWADHPVLVSAPKAAAEQVWSWLQTAGANGPGRISRAVPW